MVPVTRAAFKQDPAWIRYFRFYAKFLREIKRDVRVREDKHFDCTMCGKCCDFTKQQYRCLLSWVDVAQWHAAGFELGLLFVFPVHSIDGYSALGIPTKGELRTGKLLEWIRPFDDNGQLRAKSPYLMDELTRFLGNAPLSQGEDGTCIYLGSDHRCLIHPLRPGACRMFPYLQTKIIQISKGASVNGDEETSVPCPADAFTSENPFPVDLHQIARDCAEAEAAAWAQERIFLPEVENLLVEIWRELLPKI